MSTTRTCRSLGRWAAHQRGSNNAGAKAHDNACETHCEDDQDVVWTQLPALLVSGEAILGVDVSHCSEAIVNLLDDAEGTKKGLRRRGSFSTVSVRVEDLQAYVSLPLSRTFREGSDRRQAWWANRKVNDTSR